MNRKLIVAIVLALVLAVGLLFALWSKNQPSRNNSSVVANFDEEKQALIRVENPTPNQVLSSPFELKGQARGNWYFEASFPVRLLDAAGKELAVLPVQAEGEWMTEDFVPFKTSISFLTPATAAGTLVLEKANASGLPEHDDKLVIPVRFAQFTGEKITIKVFFGNSGKGAECEKVLPVLRELPKTTSIGRATIEELLRGIGEQEKSQGYSTAINDEVKLNSLVISNGEARADFSAELNKDVAGSCRVNAIRAQITESLKQFSTVNKVQISVNGQSEGVLEP